MTAALTILGTGHAGYTLAKEWRKLMPDAPLRLITQDDGANYYKPNLSKAFASGKNADGLIVNTVTQMAEQLEAEILTRTVITRIAPEEHCVYAGDASWEYSMLALATGADPIRVPIAGDAADTVFTVNDREDYARFRTGLAANSSVLVIGAGLVGSEFTNDLAASGYRVTAVDPAGWPLSRLVPEACGRAIESALSKLGVDWRWGRTVASIEHAGSRLRVTLSDNSILEVDRVLSAIGLRPRTALAKAAGIRCGAGIVVDDFLQTSVPGVYALGDSIEIGGRLLPFILPIAHASRALAQTLAGKPTPAVFPAMPVVVKTPACPTLVNAAPHGHGNWEFSGSAPDLEAVFKDASGQALGFTLTGATIATRRGALTALMPPVHPAKTPA